MGSRGAKARLFGTVSLTLTLVLFGPQTSSGLAGASATYPLSRYPSAERMSSGGLMFIENAGQFDAGARFQARGGSGTLWLAEEAVWLTVVRPNPPAPFPAREGGERPSPERGGAGGEVQVVNLKLTFPGANPHPRLEPFNRLEAHVSYFIGNDPAHWHAAVPVWGGVRYVDLYPGVDLEISGASGAWPFVLRAAAHPGADLNRIRLRVEGADDLDLQPNGLHLRTAAGDVVWPLLAMDGPAPSPHIADHDVLQPFTSTSTSPARRQPAQPSLLYSTYLGGSGDDAAYALTADASGAVYLTGDTQSYDFPTTTGAFTMTFGGVSDVFVTKLNATGTGLLYSTFLGGSDRDAGRDIAVDASGAVYVPGYTQSSDFPTTTGAFSTTLAGGTDAFVVKLNPAGNGQQDLVYSTYLGGSDYDEGRAIAVDASGMAYVTGRTRSANFPITPGAVQTAFGGGICGNNPCDDVFVAKLDALGSALIYSTFVGGDGYDYGRGIAVDTSGSAYVTGVTNSSGFPISPGAFQTAYQGHQDAFVTKLNAGGTQLAYSTYLGGGLGEAGRGIAVDARGVATISGWTNSPNFPTTFGAFQAAYAGGGGDAFITRVNAAGSGLLYSTFLGGAQNDGGYGGIALGPDGTVVYAGGYTYSADFPTTSGAFQVTSGGGDDAFVTKLLLYDSQIFLPLIANNH